MTEVPMKKSPTVQMLMGKEEIFRRWRRFQSLRHPPATGALSRS
jgi:hypothetical protein